MSQGVLDGWACAGQATLPVQTHRDEGVVQCLSCRRALSDPVSRGRHRGPDCWSRLTGPPPGVPHQREPGPGQLDILDMLASEGAKTVRRFRENCEFCGRFLAEAWWSSNNCFSGDFAAFCRRPECHEKYEDRYARQLARSGRH